MREINKQICPQHNLPIRYSHQTMAYLIPKGNKKYSDEVYKDLLEAEIDDMEIGIMPYRHFHYKEGYCEEKFISFDNI